MPALTLTQVFGPDATLDAGVLSIPISGLATVGLTATSTSPTEILAAIILQIVATQDANSREDVDRGVFVGDAFLSVVRNNTQIERQVPVSFYVPANLGPFDPDDVIG